MELTIRLSSAPLSPPPLAGGPDPLRVTRLACAWQWLVPALASFAFLACAGEPEDPSATVTARDSAGVEIVTSFLPLWAAGAGGWNLAEEPSLSLSGDPDHPAQTLFGVTGVQLLSDGRIVVGNSGTDELLVFDSGGSFLTVWGGPGEGPGELDGIRSLLKCGGDTILVEERARVSLFDPQGRFMRAATTVRGLAPHSAFDLVGATRDCSRVLLAVRQTPHPDHAGEVLHREVETYWAALRGRERKALGTFAGSQVLAVDLGGSLTVVRFAFGVEPQWASDGRLTFYGPADRDEIRVLSEDSRLVRIMRWETPRDSITEEEWNRWFQQRDRYLAQSPYEAPAFPPRGEHPDPGFKPAYAGLMVDEAGYLWVREYTFPTFIEPDRGPQRWWVFDPEGQWLGEISTPAGFRVEGITKDFVMGVSSGGDDVERVELYSLRK